MPRSKQKHGRIPEDTRKSMMEDYVIKKMTIRAIADHYQLAKSTVGRIAADDQWKLRRKSWDNRNLKKATTERANSANLIIGQMMDIFERHASNLLLLSQGIAPSRIIPQSVVDEAYKLMGYMDRIAGQIQKSRENLIPDTLDVQAPDLNPDRIIERMEAGLTAGRKQLLEWEESRDPSLKEKEPEDIFDAQASEKEVKEDDEDITFEGLNEDIDTSDDDGSPIGGIL